MCNFDCIAYKIVKCKFIRRGCRQFAPGLHSTIDWKIDVFPSDDRGCVYIHRAGSNIGDIFNLDLFCL